MLPSRSLEYFLSSQHWLDGFSPPRAAHYERLCACLRQWLTDAPTQPVRPEPVAAPTPTAAAVGSDSAAIHRTPVSAEQRRELEMRLARILGPIAGLLVDRAAAVAENFLELERRLAAELDSPEDRKRFLRSPQ